MQNTYICCSVNVGYYFMSFTHKHLLIIFQMNTSPCPFLKWITSRLTLRRNWMTPRRFNKLTRLSQLVSRSKDLTPDLCDLAQTYIPWKPMLLVDKLDCPRTHLADYTAIGIAGEVCKPPAKWSMNGNSSYRISSVCPCRTGMLISSCRKIWRAPLPSPLHWFSTGIAPHPKLVYFFSKQLALCVIVALGGAIFILDWILYWHMKW